MNTIESKKHPFGLWVISVFAGIYAIAFGILSSLLVLYLRQDLNFTHGAAYELFAAFMSLIFMLPLAGGYAAGQFGYKRAMYFGILTALLGCVLLAIKSVATMYLGVSIFIVGVSFAGPTYLVLQGKIYAKDDHRRDSGFTISYLIMNIGFVIASITGGYLEKDISFSSAFLVGAVVLLLAFLLMVAGMKHMRPHRGRDIKPRLHIKPIYSWCGLLLSGLVLLPIVYLLLTHTAFNRELLEVLIALVIVFLLVLALRQKRKKNRRRLLAFVILSIVSICFWALYMLEPSLITVFVESNVNRVVLGNEIPPSAYYSLDPIFIVLLGWLFSKMWVYLSDRNKDLSLPSKFSSAIISMAVGFLVLVLAIAVAKDQALNSLWIVLSYFFLTTGELLISPIGQAMVGRLSPEGLEGLLMGIWQAFTGVSAVISSYMAEWAVIPKGMTTIAQTNPIYQWAFLKIAIVTIVLGLVSCLLIKPIKKIMA